MWPKILNHKNQSKLTYKAWFYLISENERSDLLLLFLQLRVFISTLFSLPVPSQLEAVSDHVFYGLCPHRSRSISGASSGLSTSPLSSPRVSKLRPQHARFSLSTNQHASAQSPSCQSYHMPFCVCRTQFALLCAQLL